MPGKEVYFQILPLCVRFLVCPARGKLVTTLQSAGFRRVGTPASLGLRARLTPSSLPWHHKCQSIFSRYFLGICRNPKAVCLQHVHCSFSISVLGDLQDTPIFGSTLSVPFCAVWAGPQSARALNMQQSWARPQEGTKRTAPEAARYPPHLRLPGTKLPLRSHLRLVLRALDHCLNTILFHETELFEPKSFCSRRPRYSMCFIHLAFVQIWHCSILNGNKLNIYL